MKMILAAIVGFIVLPFSVKATMLITYPVYGYNEINRICEVKQVSEESEVREGLIGDYSSVRACRWGNPEILLSTGLGILLWIGLFFGIVLKNFGLVPWISKNSVSPTARKVNTVFEFQLIFISLFLLVLFRFYFDVPVYPYQYTSDLDNLTYGVFIQPRIPLVYVFIYIAVSLGLLYRHSRSLSDQKKALYE